MALVFQFGSNVRYDRLNSPQRLNGDARLVDVVRTREAFELDFTVWSEGNGCAAADMVPGRGRSLWGVLYEVPDFLVATETAGGRRSFDEIECEYVRSSITVVSGDGHGVETEALTYMVPEKRFDLRTGLDYVTHILTGLREREVPGEYIDYVRDRILTNNPALDGELAGARC
jgi:hypothetical protein